MYIFINIYINTYKDTYLHTYLYIHNTYIRNNIYIKHSPMVRETGVQSQVE